MTPSRVAYGFLVHALVLLILYALVNLIAAITFLPGDHTQNLLSLNRVSSGASALMQLSITAGLLGSGISALTTLSIAGKSALSGSRGGSLRLALRLFTLLSFLTVAAATLDRFPSPFLAILRAGIIFLVIAALLPGVSPRSAIPAAWLTGMTMASLVPLISLAPLSDPIANLALRILADGAALYLGDLLAALAIAYWLMRRFSNVSALWAGMSLYTVAGLLALAGALVTLPALYPLGWDASFLGDLSAFAVPLLALIIASHSYRALSDRNSTNTLAAHWTALFVLLLLLGVGILGGLQAAPGVRLYAAGTQLSALPAALARLAVVVVILGASNQISAELRGENRRVTGLAPFWLVTFGVLGGALALAGAGLVQVYLERVLSVGYLETQALIAPLYGAAVVAAALLALGIVVYAAAFFIRRPNFGHNP